MSNILEEYIRPVRDGDEKLPEFSHSRLECFDNCAYQYNLKYNEGKVAGDTTIALQIGSCFHLALEYKGKMLLEEGRVDYEYLENLVMNGGESDDGHGKAINIAGVNELKKTYWDIWNIADDQGRTYNDKLSNFMSILHTEMEEEDGWEPVAFEQEFSFVWNNAIRIRGFIDRIDRRNDEFRLVDYKTSKKIYDQNKLSTSQQFALYNMALLLNEGTIAAENMYRFICINDSQLALTKGWEKRIITRLDKLINKLNEYDTNKLYPPHPSPLCHFCSFCITNKDATKYKRECDYYMKWTRENKDFSVNKEWNPESITKTQRKLIF